MFPVFFNRRLNLEHIRRFALCIRNYTYTNHTCYVMNLPDKRSDTGCQPGRNRRYIYNVRSHIHLCRQYQRSSGMSSYPGTTVTDRTFPICCLYTYYYRHRFYLWWGRSVSGNYRLCHYQTPHTHRSAPHYGTHHA